MIKDNSDLQLEVFIPYQFNRISEAVSKGFATIYKHRYGMTRPEWRTLSALGELNTMTATEIGLHSDQHKTKVSRAVFSLEKRGWVKREIKITDRRAEHLILTKSGFKAYQDLADLALKYERNLLSQLTKEDAESLLKGLNACMSILNKTT